jgi:hypothetical protein
MKTVKKSDVTYAQLDATLRSLGFEASAVTNMLGFPGVCYENTEADTIIALRAGKPNELLNAIDLLSAEITIEGRGVVDRETFGRLLRENSREVALAA